MSEVIGHRTAALKFKPLARKTILDDSKVYGECTPLPLPKNRERVT